MGVNEQCWERAWLLWLQRSALRRGGRVAVSTSIPPEKPAALLFSDSPQAVLSLSQASSGDLHDTC